MANTKTAIIKVEFLFEPEITHCNIFYKSDEPGNPFWGGGWKTKSFPKSKSAIDILVEESADYIMWNDGKEELKEIAEPEDFKA
jgi:hypothetical protein